MISNKYRLEGLTCAHCASKIEEKVAKQSGYSNVDLIFATKTLKIDTEKEIPTLKADIQKIVDSIEDGVTVTEYDGKHIHSSHSEEESDCGCCGEEHEHHHEHHHDHGHHCSGHDHDHEHEHDHEHHHEHDHKHGHHNEYGHSHEHHHGGEKHEHSHEHGDSDEIKGTVIRGSIAVLIFAATILLEHFVPSIPSIIGYLLGTVIVGYPVFITGAKALFKLRFDETLLLLIAVIAAFGLGEYFEAALVTLLFMIGEMFEDIAVSKSRRDIEKLAEIRPDTALYSDNGRLAEKPAESIKIGDTIVVKPFTRVPLDGIITDGTSSIDTSAVTGESIPVPVKKGSEVMSGTVNCDGMLSVSVTKTYETSTASRILQLVEESAAQKGSSEKFITKFAKIYTPVVLISAVLVVLIPTIINPSLFTQWLKRALVFLVASCPCAIVISVPLGFYSGIGRASKHGILIKGGKYIEALSHARAVVFDKTGTLTQGRPIVTDVKCVGKMSKDEVLSLAASVEKYSVHPIAAAIKSAVAEDAVHELENYSEIPATGTRAVYNGHIIECGGKRVLNEKEAAEYAEFEGCTFLTLDGKVEGIISVEDAVRDEAADTCKNLKKCGINRLVMLTGDNKEVAERVAKQCGIDEFHASLLPQDKVQNAEKIKEKYGTIIFVGDGINDAPVLTISDCGFAMGLGSEAAIESADAVLSDNSLKQLPLAIKIARKTLATVKFNIVFAIAIKVIVLALAVLGFAPIWLAVFADTGVSVLCILNSARLLKSKIA